MSETPFNNAAVVINGALYAFVVAKEAKINTSTRNLYILFINIVEYIFPVSYIASSMIYFMEEVGLMI